MPTVTFAGIGSGMDIESLIEGLVSVSRQPISIVKSRASSVRSAITSVSDVGTLLSKLKDSTAALDTLQEVGSFKASSGNESAAVVTANGSAQAGTYEVEVVQLARADRRYSNAFSTANQALGLSGTLTLQIGTGDTVGPGNELLVGAATAAIDITSADTLDGIISKINSSGLRLKATSFFDGSEYRLQIKGLDVGEENQVNVVQSGLDLGLNEESNIKETAQNAIAKIDGFTVESKNNQLSQSIPGVTIALKQETTSPFTISVESDSEALAAKVDTFVKDYNAVINKIHQSAGFGSIKASNPVLAGDSTLRRVGNELSRAIGQTFGNGSTNTLAGLGIKLNNDGTLLLDRTKLDKAIAESPDLVSGILAGNDSQGGAMDALFAVSKALTAPDTGALSIRKDGLGARAKSYDDQVAREEDRLVSLEERLRKTFTQMDSTVAAYNAQLQALISGR